MKNPYACGAFRMLSNYGCRIDPMTGKYSFHCGIDLCGLDSAEVCAVGDGYSVALPDCPELGCYVAVRGDDGCTVCYGHLSEKTVQPGERVRYGQVIGTEGSSGCAPGRHFHLEIRRGRYRINAADYIDVPNSAGIYG